MYTLKDFQEKAVTGLLYHTCDALRDASRAIPILLEAPTGSGKTVIMAAFLERLVDELGVQPGLHSNVAFIWFAPNTLHIQSFEALRELYADTSKLNCLDLSNLSNNPELNPKDLLFVNWSSVDSLTKLWRKDNENNINLESLIENTRISGTEIVLIIDEAHLSAFTGVQAIAVRRLIDAKIEMLVTATPAARPALNVVIPRSKVIAEQMIKKGVRLNIGLDPAQQAGDNVHMHLLRTALAKRKELKRFYDAELGPDKLNPLLLIQLPSDNANMSAEDSSIREAIEGILSMEENITTQNGRLAIWLSGERIKDGLEEPNGLQDVLIFKQAIAQGWNCPRAAVLISYRTVQSPDFGIQTVGRILRMPHQMHYRHDDLNYGYVYTNIETTQINFVPTDADYFNIQIAERVEDGERVYNKINAATIVNDRPSKGVLSSTFEIQFFQEMERRYGVVELPDVDLFTEADEAQVKAQKEQNRIAMRQAGWEFIIDEHQIHIPTDIELDPYQVTAIALNNSQVRHFAITASEFSVLFDRFAYDSVTRLNRSKSWKKMRETLIHFAEYYLGLFEHEAHKFFLYPQNNALLVPIIITALERFDTYQAAKGNENKRVEYNSWSVPEVRYYNDLYEREDLNRHALEPFYEYNRASSVEKAFKELLEQQAKEIEWWYKNGDNGSEHFAIEYTNLQGELKLFFVDFVVKFNSGVIGLFDTKTKRSDANAPNKHNGLITYLEREQAANPMQQLIGGVIIPEEVAGVISFRYCTNRITDTNDLTGWDYFDAAAINRIHQLA